MTKSIKHWYSRYPADYRAKTAGLSLMQHGAYTLLLDEYYNTGKPLPANASRLHRICSAIAKDEQEAVDFIIDSFFIKTETGYMNKRADEELERRVDISNKRRNAANLRHANAPANAPANAYTSTSTSTLKYKESIKNGFDFNVDIHLSDLDRECAKSEAPGWDLYFLIREFNKFTAVNETPKYPAKAFIVWCKNFTKGKPPS